MPVTSGIFSKSKEDWQDFPSVAAGVFLTGATSNPSYGTVVKNKAQWKKDKGDMLIRWDYIQSGAGGAGSGLYLINIPASIGVIDTTKITPTGGDGTAKVGDFYSFNCNMGTVFVYSTSQIAMIAVTTLGSTATGVGGSYSGLNNATQYYSVTARVPIVGWSAND